MVKLSHNSEAPLYSCIDEFDNCYWFGVMGWLRASQIACTYSFQKHYYNGSVYSLFNRLDHGLQ